MKSGATPAIGAITENDSRFEVLQVLLLTSRLSCKFSTTPLIFVWVLSDEYIIIVCKFNVNSYAGQFWKGQLKQSAYEAWPLSKRASLDHWIAREVLKWQPHQTRYLAKEEFEKELAPVREFLFAEEIKVTQNLIRSLKVIVVAIKLITIRTRIEVDQFLF